MTPQLIQLKSLPNVALVRLLELNGELELYYGSPTMDGSESIYLVEHVYGPGKKILVKIGVVKDGNWRIVSTMADLTEEEAIDLVDWYHVSDNEDLTAALAYKDYINGEDDADDYWDEYMLDTAIESFHSAIRASGWLLENTYPIINDPKFYDEPYDGSGFYQELYSGALDDWKQRQSRTLKTELTLILTKD